MNYSRNFEDGGGGDGGDRRGGGDRPFRGRGGGRGGRGGRGGGGGDRDFDGKQQRRPVARKTVDYHAGVMRSESLRFLTRDYRDQPGLEPTPDSQLSLDAVLENTQHNPSMGICTRYVALAVNKIRAPITAMAWLPEGRRLLTGSHTGEFTLWNGAQFNFEGIVQQAHDEPVRSMQWSHGGAVMLSADEGGVVKYWQSSLNNLKAFKAHKEPIRDLSFSPSDVHFVTASDDQSCSIWDTETSAEVTALKGHGWDVKAAKWHPSKGLIITGGKDQLIKLWDPRSNAGSVSGQKDKHCLSDIHAHKNTVNRLAWCPTNPHWFLSGSRDNLVKVFDLRTMKEIQTHRAHKKEITALTWHPHIERLFASGSYDGTIFKWLVGESDAAAEITGAHDSAVYGLEWHPLGHMLASASNDHTTRFWVRNRPGDEMTDKYNVNSLPEAQKVEAVHVLVEAAQKNPSKYSRLPAALASIAEQSNPDAAGGGGDMSAFASARVAAAMGMPFHDPSSDVIPGMGAALTKVLVKVKSEPGAAAVAGASGAAASAAPAGFAGYAPPVGPPPSASRGAGASGSGRERDDSRERDSRDYGRSSASSSRRRSRSRSRERDEGRDSRSSVAGAHHALPSHAAASANRNAFFPAAAAATAQQPPAQAYQPYQPHMQAAHQPQQHQYPPTSYAPQRPPQQYAAPPTGYPPQPQQPYAAYPPQPQPYGGYAAPAQQQPPHGYGAMPPQTQQPYPPQAAYPPQPTGGFAGYAPPPPQPHQPQRR